MHNHWSATAIQSLLSLPGIHPHIRHFKYFPSCVDGFVRAPSNTLLEKVSQCAPLFAELLASLPNLATLCFIPKLSGVRDHLDVMAILRFSAPLPLSALRTLRVPEHALFLCNRAPMVDSLFVDTVAWTHDWPHLPGVKRLGIAHMPKDVAEGRSYLRAILQRMPNVESLTLDSGYFSIEGLLGDMRGFLRLRLVTLGLPELENLEVGYPLRIGCRMTKEKRERLLESQKTARNRVKTAAVAAFPCLKYLWIGSHEIFDLTHLGIQDGRIPSGNGRCDALDQLEPIYVPLGGSVLAYIDDPACLLFSA